MKTKFNNVQVLSDKSLFEGIKHCFENSNNLYKSATTLKRNKQYGPAVTMLILSVEELMTCLALFNIAVSDKRERKLFKELFESGNLHKVRHEYALVMTQYFESFNYRKFNSWQKKRFSAENLASALNESVDFDKMDENITNEKKSKSNWFGHANEQKNAGLYVAFNGKWFTPQRVNEKTFNKAKSETQKIKKKLSDFFKQLLPLSDAEFSQMIKIQKQAKKKFLKKSGLHQEYKTAIKDAK